MGPTKAHFSAAHSCCFPPNPNPSPDPDPNPSPNQARMALIEAVAEAEEEAGESYQGQVAGAYLYP